jgi:mannose-6-phosphate isomerase-like protein (cupin superfamily)
MAYRSLPAYLAVCLMLTALARTQDPVKVDPKHYSVLTENERVRILKVHYGPHEKSVWHSHPAVVVVFLTDAKATLAFKEAKTSHLSVHAGDTVYSPPLAHLPVNTGDQPLDLIEIELKKPPKAAKPQTK